jgi:hypothetical protein
MTPGNAKEILQDLGSIAVSIAIVLRVELCAINRLRAMPEGLHVAVPGTRQEIKLRPQSLDFPVVVFLNLDQLAKPPKQGIGLQDAHGVHSPLFEITRMV